MPNFSSDELHIVQRYLVEEEEFLFNERMKIECGDDFAATNKKWPRVVKLSEEQSFINVLQKRTQAHLVRACEREWGVKK
tara:strand:- start:1037 stop:1276 length:240 start_codon:yes stop_codon:yes gene_type:complete